MIKKYINFINESLLDKLKGPSEEELWNNLKELEPNDMLVKTAELGLLKGVKLALELGADINIKKNLSLRYTAARGHLDVVKYLVEQGADIHVNDDAALRYAAEKGYLDVVKYLVEQGADIHAYNDDALRNATSNGQLNVVKYLVEQGADIHVNNGCIIRFATEYGYSDILEYLEEQIKKEKLTESLLDELIGPSEEEIIENLKDNPEKLLVTGCEMKSEKVINSALDLGANGKRFLYYASALGKYNVVDILLRYGIKPTENAIQQAELHFYDDVVKLLKKYMKND